MRPPMLNVTAEDQKHIFVEQPTSLIRFAPCIFHKSGNRFILPWDELKNVVSVLLIQPLDYTFL